MAGRPPIRPVHEVEEAKDSVAEMNEPLPAMADHDFSPLPWQDFYDSMEYIDENIPVFWAGNAGPVFLMVHGAGHCALTFAALARIVKTKYQVVSFDFRGHGLNKLRGEEEYNFTPENLCNEVKQVLAYIKSKVEDPVLLCGHSMGGAIACRVGAEMESELAGMIIIDVVEGTAIEALPFMDNILLQRPKTFASMDDAIKYINRSRTIRKLSSARVSMTTQVVLVNPDDPASGYIWRTDLARSRQHWESWFTGITACFLGTRIPRSVILAGNDRMDQEMTIAHMQGKFKLSTMNHVGHVIQEDDPRKLAELLKEFVTVFKIGQSLPFLNR